MAGPTVEQQKTAQAAAEQRNRDAATAKASKAQATAATAAASASRKQVAAQQKESTGTGRYVRTEAGARRYRVPIGSEIGTAASQSGADAQADVRARENYERLVGGSSADRRGEMTKLSDQSLLKVLAVANSFKSNDPNVVAFRNELNAEAARRKRMNPRFGLKGKAKAPAKKKAAKGKAKKATHAYTKQKGLAYNRGSGSTWVASMNKATGFANVGESSQRLIELTRTNGAANPTLAKLRKLIAHIDEAPPELQRAVAEHTLQLAQQLDATHMVTQHVVELAGRWKHGWIPLDGAAHSSKMKGGKGKPWWEGGGPQGSPKGSGDSSKLTSVVKSGDKPSPAKETPMNPVARNPESRAKLISEGAAARKRQGAQTDGDKATEKAIGELKQITGKPSPKTDGMGRPAFDAREQKPIANRQVAAISRQLRKGKTPSVTDGSLGTIEERQAANKAKMERIGSHKAQVQALKPADQQAYMQLTKAGKSHEAAMEWIENRDRTLNPATAKAHQRAQANTMKKGPSFEQMTEKERNAPIKTSAADVEKAQKELDGEKLGKGLAERKSGGLGMQRREVAKKPSSEVSKDVKKMTDPELKAYHKEQMHLGRTSDYSYRRRREAEAEMERRGSTEFNGQKGAPIYLPGPGKPPEQKPRPLISQAVTHKGGPVIPGSSRLHNTDGSSQTISDASANIATGLTDAQKGQLAQLSPLERRRYAAHREQGDSHSNSVLKAREGTKAIGSANKTDLSKLPQVSSGVLANNYLRMHGPAGVRKKIAQLEAKKTLAPSEKGLLSSLKAVL